MIGTTKVMLSTLDPITLPTTISVFFLIIALIVAANSGKLVPIAIIVKPITSSDIFSKIAIFSAYITAKFEPTIKTTKQSRRYNF